MSKEGKVNNSDARESTIDELTSLGIWIFAALGCLESLSRTFGFGIGSVFALGGEHKRTHDGPDRSYSTVFSWLIILYSTYI